MNGDRIQSQMVEAGEEDWLQGLVTLTAEDVDPDWLAHAAMDSRGVHDPEEAEGALYDIFEAAVMWPVFSQFGQPQSFWLQSGLRVSQVIAAAHPRTPVSTLSALAACGDPYVVWALGTNEAAPRELLLDLYETGLTIPDAIECETYLSQVWHYPGFEDPGGTDEVTGLSTRVAVASNPRCPEQLIDAIITSGTDMELQALFGGIVRDQRTLTDRQWNAVLERAVASNFAGWTHFLCASHSLPIVVGLQLMDCADPFLADFARGVIGCSDACPEDVVRQLAESSHVRSRWAAASNRTSPQAILLKLAIDGEEIVRRAVKDNPSASDEVLAAIVLG